MAPVSLKKKEKRDKNATALMIAKVLGVAVVLFAVWLVLAPSGNQLGREIRVLEAWSRKHKVMYNNAEIRYVPEYEGYGLFAKADFKRGDAILVIPREAVLNLEHLRMSKFKDILAPLVKMQLSSTVIMGMFVSWAMHDPEATTDPVVNKFMPYLKSFPAGDNLMATWTQEEIMRSRVQVKLPGIHLGLYPVLVKQLTAAAPGAVYNKDGTMRKYMETGPFMWGQAMSASRAFGDLPHKGHAPDDLARSFSNLIPIGGVMNHEPTNKGMRIMNGDQDKVWFAAGRAIKRGEEIFNAYGSSSFTKMMPQYGFMDPYSPMDKMHETFVFPEFPLTPDLFPSFTTTPLGHLNRNASDPAARGQNRYGIDYRQHNVTTLLPFVRIGVFASGKKLAETTQSMRDALTKKAMCLGKPDFVTCGISKANEAMAVRKLREHLQTLRDEYAQPMGAPEKPMRPIVERISNQLRERAVIVLDEMLRWVDENGVYAQEDIEANSGLLVQRAPKQAVFV